jgi:phosphate starvation-inducible PhoH-like protein
VRPPVPPELAAHDAQQTAPDGPSVRLDNPHVLREVVGDLDAHLRMIGEAFGASLERRGDLVLAAGSGDGAGAIRFVQQLAALARSGRRLHPRDVSDALRVVAREPDADLSRFYAETVHQTSEGRAIGARTVGQQRYLRALKDHAIVFGVGPAGTGKTYLAIAAAVAALKRGEVKRIVLTRPAVEAGERLGFLPGGIAEKVDPYLRPLFDALEDLLSPEELARLFERRIVEIAPLAFMRGRTLSNAAVVLDEAQNTTVAQMKMFLTRLGENTRMIITGDITQIDLPYGKGSGLVDGLRVLEGVKGIAVVRLDTRDVVRHPLVGRIVAAYEADAERRSGGGEGDERRSKFDNP